MTRIVVPSTLNEAVHRLEGLERLLTAQGWERAAIVYAFTYEPGPGGDRRSDHRVEVNADRLMTPNEFAAKGVVGLRSGPTVYEYRRHWQYAIDQHWATAMEPGDDFDFPALDNHHYPPTARPQKIETPEEQVATIRRYQDESPDVRKAIEDDFVERAARNRDLYERVQSAHYEQLPTLMSPASALGAASRLELFGVGSTLAAEIEYKRDRVAALVRYLESHQPLSPDDDRLMHDTVRAIERGRQHLGGYEDRIYEAGGVHRDEIARRLITSLAKGDGQ